MDAADVEQGAGAAAAAAMDESCEPTPEQRAAMEALGVTHLLDPAEQQEFLRKVQESMDAGAGQMPVQVAPEIRGLIEAAENGNTGAVVAALEAGVDINATGEDGDTALHLACLHGKTEVAKLLLTRGANPNVRDGDDSSPLHDCSAGGYRDIAYYLLDSGADANAQDSDGDTPLHLACNGDHAEVADLLIQRGANMGVKNGANRLPITMSRNPDVVEVFKRAMAMQAMMAPQ
jgi:hypothetical protein